MKSEILNQIAEVVAHECEVSVSDILYISVMRMACRLRL